MASSIKLPFALILSSLFVHAALGGLSCESLPKDVCAWAVASSGKRCVLENYESKDGSMELLCKTSEVVAENMADYIETDQCVRACGVDRKNIGISSDALLEPDFTAKLCSPDCYQKCPNIIDLYFNLASGEGAFLPDICNSTRHGKNRRMMAELSSSGAAESDDDDTADAPAPAPTQ